MPDTYQEIYKITDTELKKIEDAIRFKKNYPSSYLIPTASTDYFINTLVTNQDIASYINTFPYPVLKPHSVFYYGVDSLPIMNNPFHNYNTVLGDSLISGQIHLLNSYLQCYNLEYNHAFYFEANEIGTPLIKGYFWNGNTYLYNTSPNPIVVYNNWQYNNIVVEDRSSFILNYFTPISNLNLPNTQTMGVYFGIVNTKGRRRNSQYTRDYGYFFEPNYFLERYYDTIPAASRVNNTTLWQYFYSKQFTERAGQYMYAFNVMNYRNKYSDLNAAFGYTWGYYYGHYVVSGYNEGRRAP